jgi:hypothetical protein
MDRRKLVFVLALLAGCERNNPTPPGSDAGPRDAAPRLDAPELDAAGDAATLDGGTLDAQVDAALNDSGTCAVDGGTCYACAPSTSDQLLNACTSKACTPFANTAARLPLLRPDGTLPPLD